MPLVLGSIVFKDYEIPQRLHFGMQQRLAVHKLLGGQRVVDALGPDDTDPQWHGRFQGADASDRARALVALAGSGAQVPLSFGSFLYLVVVQRAECDFERWYQIPYHVTCTVVTSPMGGVFAGAAATLDDLVSGDMAALAGLVSDFAGAA